jgi:hypothetical protein
MSTTVYPGATRTVQAGTVSFIMAQLTAQAEKESQTANFDYKDVVEKVINKLAVLDNLFEFFQYTKNMTDFSHDTIPGLCYVIGDCINELKTVV